MGIRPKVRNGNWKEWESTAEEWEGMGIKQSILAICNIKRSKKLQSLDATVLSKTDASIIIIILYTYIAHQTIKLSLMRLMRILTEPECFKGTFKWGDGNWVPHVVRKSVPVVRAGMRKCTSAIVWQVIARVVQKTTRSRAEMMTTWYTRDRQTEFCKVLRCQTVQTLVHRRAQFEDDALRDVQYVRQTPIKLSSSSNDSESSVQDPLQLVSYSVRCVRKQCTTMSYDDHAESGLITDLAYKSWDTLLQTETNRNKEALDFNGRWWFQG